MRKFNKILLGGLICATSFAFASNVKAKAVVEYPEYKVGDKVIYDSVSQESCNDFYKNCKAYKVVEDSSKNDLNIKVENINDQNDKLTLTKLYFVNGYVVSATKETELNGCFGKVIGKEDCGDGDPTDMEEVTKVRYFLSSEIKALLDGAKQYDNFQLFNNAGVDLENDSIVIPKGVNVTASYIYAKKLINNGSIYTGYVWVKNVSGSGIINLDYDVYVGDSGDDILDEADRLATDDISGVKIELESKIVKEGTIFGLIGNTTMVTYENAQEVINMYNKVLGQSFNGYQIKLKSKTHQSDPSEKYYYGVLAKKEVQTTTKSDNKSNGSDTKNNDAKDFNNKKQEVKNPSTSDDTNITAIILMISGAIAAITLKKVKQR